MITTRPCWLRTSFLALVVVAAAVLLPHPATALLPRRTFGAVGAASAVGAAAALFKKATDPPPPTSYYTPAVDSLLGQTIVITGGTTGLGLETAKRLAVGGANIVLTARSDAKGQAAVQAVQDYVAQQQQTQTTTPSSSFTVQYKLLDLNDLTAVQQAVDSWKDVSTIDVLVNNAGIMALPHRELTTDGYEKQMQSNHLGHFVLTAKLAPKLAQTARIINVSSEAHRFVDKSMDFDYMWEGAPDYGPWKSYGHSKLANLYFSQELQRRANAAGRSWDVASLHPGAVGTDLGRYLVGEEAWNKLKAGKAPAWQEALAKTMNALLVKSVPDGATTQIYLAAGAYDNLDPPAGRYYVDSQVRPLSALAQDATAAARLWKESEERSGVTFDLTTNTAPTAPTATATASS